MSCDIEGNVVREGDIVYTSHPARAGSNSPRLLRCEVLGVSKSGAMLKLRVLENERTINKTTACCVRPRQ